MTTDERNRQLAQSNAYAQHWRDTLTGTPRCVVCGVLRTAAPQSVRFDQITSHWLCLEHWIPVANLIERLKGESS